MVKVGSSLVTNEGRGLDEVKPLASGAAKWRALVRDPGREVIMVSSGAIAEGMKRLGWTTRPSELHELQAAAAVGQMGLAQMYETKLREQRFGFGASAFDPCRFGRPRALSQCAFHLVDFAHTWCVARDQRERHGGERRNQVW